MIRLRDEARRNIPRRYGADLKPRGFRLSLKSNMVEIHRRAMHWSQNLRTGSDRLREVGRRDQIRLAVDRSRRWSITGSHSGNKDTEALLLLTTFMPGQGRGASAFSAGQLCEKHARNKKLEINVLLHLSMNFCGEGEELVPDMFKGRGTVT